MLDSPTLARRHSVFLSMFAQLLFVGIFKTQPEGPVDKRLLHTFVARSYRVWYDLNCSADEQLSEDERGVIFPVGYRRTQLQVHCTNIVQNWVREPGSAGGVGVVLLNLSHRVTSARTEATGDAHLSVVISHACTILYNCSILLLSSHKHN